MCSARRGAQQAEEQGGAGASPRGADAAKSDPAKISSDIGFVLVDGNLECSVVITARNIVNKRW